jgi:hypothetical protein
MRSLFKKHRILLATAILLVVILAVFIVIANRQQNQKDAHPLADPHVGFRMYEPVKMPQGFRITDKRISIRHASFYDSESGNPNKLVNASLEMNLRTTDWVYAINERRASDKDKESVATKLTNYDTLSNDPTCRQDASPKGQQFRLCHWVDYGKISVFEVRFIKGTTFINTTFPSTLDKPMSLDAIHNYVDSFSEKDPEGLPILADTI